MISCDRRRQKRGSLETAVALFVPVVSSVYSNKAPLIWLATRASKSTVRLLREESRTAMDPAQPSEERVAKMISGVAAYLLEEREIYFRASDPLTREWRGAVKPFFSKALLENVRTVVLEGARIPPPPFYSEAIAMSSGNFPDFVHLASVTYLDIIVFHDQIVVRTLFHGLVHAAQMAFLGLDRYTDFYVRRFLKSRSWIAIPLEAQAYQLDTRFAMSPTTVFSVEDEVKSWAEQGLF